MKAADMRHWAIRHGTAAALALSAALACGAASAQISNTKHNLTPSGPGTVKLAPGGGNEEICVFCHTPHGANSSAGGPPLWNKGLPATGGFTLYSTSTLDSTIALSGSPSLACLSCHDGVSAMDNIVNAPGSGGWTPTTGADMAWTWAGGSDKMPAGGITNIGQDLSNDHPIGMNYCGFSAADTGSGAITCRDTDFHTTTGANNNVKFNASKQVWWVETPGSPTANREKQDLPLYTRTVGSVTGPYVECQSCHDPHVSNTTFLRVANTGSQLCLSCHVK